MSNQLPAGADILSAAQILKLHKAPLYSVDGFSVAAGIIDIVGVVLAPDGDASKVSIETSPGVHATLLYPLASPEVKPYYWYWPQSENSRYIIRIDLAQTTDPLDSFAVRFRFDCPPAQSAELKDTFHIPKDLRLYQTFPNAKNLTRVQFFDNISGVVVRGYSDYRRLRAIAEAAGLDLAKARILDWGCGHGRVIRYFEDIGADVELHGVDIDPENAAWADQNLPRVTAVHGPLMPPLAYPDNHFDFIFGISVMTHLTMDVQEAWLKELQRVTKPGGIVAVTFSGDTDVAFTSRSLDQAYIDNYIATGRGVDLPSGDLVGVIDDPSYYKNVKVSAKRVRSFCAPYFEVIDVLECMFGYQDLAVLKKRQ